MNGFDIHAAMAVLRQEAINWQTPAVTIVSQREGNPFKVLISCLLSLRTQDSTTGPASERLFALAATPEKMMLLSRDEIERAIYPVGFYRNKASQISEICHRLVEHYDGMVPDEIEPLLELKGVGRKTANLVVTLGFGKPGICVDTHVHRICNRWGYIATRTPEQTEMALRKCLPQEYWIEINDLLVAFGQNICRPLSPYCTKCRLADICKRCGVTRFR
ncbi:endonuclease III [Geobacter sp. OR-1]|uniref:endonuclease III domain-containing protein n=1 Tax=Geobacter sp. OR-1 TaxID=1266765 RepID=UPI0005434126|nr:endonuclease III [Geobacter sp. OR-1]GAM09303.1 endonuclease III [Geobacter sp. OR-1]